jgi:hypothetical protein
MGILQVARSDRAHLHGKSVQEFRSSELARCKAADLARLGAHREEIDIS